jgi:regulator of nucleoside diphosphate kinase
MQTIKNRLVLTKDDYDTIMGYIKKGLASIMFSRQDAEELETELKNAKIVTKNELPNDVVRINSTVTIKEEKENKEMKLTVVPPEKANIKQRFISIMSPVGTALIGFRKGQKVQWRAPAGKKIFTITNVQHQLSS